MSRNQLFVLHEATLTLFPTGASGEALTDSPIWIGACEEDLSLAHGLVEFRIAGSGDAYPRAFHTGEETLIDIGRLWVLPLPGMDDYKPARNQRHILEIVWSDEKRNLWTKRTYYGVTARNYDLRSQGIMQFLASQSFRAERYTQRSGTGIYSPLIPACAEQNVPFFHDGPVVTGDYFSGHYLWGELVQVETAKAIAMAGQVTPSVFELEVGGVLSGQTITLPIGVLNAEVTATSSFGSLFIPANSLVRWKAVSGPASTLDLPWTAAIVMRVRPASGAVGTIVTELPMNAMFTSVGSLVTGDYLLGEHKAAENSAIIRVIVNCTAPTGSVTLRPDVNGAPDASLDMVIASGETRLDTVFNRALFTNDTVRWKCATAPGVLNSASEASLNMTVRAS